MRGSRWPGWCVPRDRPGCNKAHGPLRCFVEFWPFGLHNLGADPVELLRTCARDGFTIRLIDSDRREALALNVDAVMSACSADPYQFVDLLLEKD